MPSAITIEQVDPILGKLMGLLGGISLEGLLVESFAVIGKLPLFLLSLATSKRGMA